MYNTPLDSRRESGGLLVVTTCNKILVTPNLTKKILVPGQTPITNHHTPTKKIPPYRPAFEDNARLFRFAIFLFVFEIKNRKVGLCARKTGFFDEKFLLDGNSKIWYTKSF